MPSLEWPRRFLRGCLPAVPPAGAATALRTGLGALAGLFVTGYVSEVLLPSHGMMLVLIAPMGAAAVLLFAAPAAPLAQPWSVMVGNGVSALIGLACLNVVGYSLLGAATAVGTAIAAMTLLRALHPPGGAVALAAVLGGPMVADAGLGFVWHVLLNAALLLCAAILFNNLTGRPYPSSLAATTAAAPRPPALAVPVSPADWATALRQASPARLDRSAIDELARCAEALAWRRCLPAPCAILMSRTALVGTLTMTAAAAAGLLRLHGRPALVVVDPDFRPLGLVRAEALTPGRAWFGRRRLAGLLEPRADLGTTPGTPLFEIAPQLAAGPLAHWPILDEQGRVIGEVAREDVARRLAEAALDEGQDGAAPVRLAQAG
jgi:CBS domain-containing membrane protein